MNVIEGLIAGKLSDILAEYIENVNRDDLKLSGSSFNLKGLILKKSALDNFDLPVSVVHGKLGVFQVSIPWTSLKSSPVKVVISDVHLVVKPRSLREYNEEEDVARQQKQKQKALATYEAHKLQKKAEALDDGQQKKKEESGGWLSYLTGSNIVQTIINNLHIKIENIHIRFEDPSDADNPVAIGISLEELSLSTADAQWNKAFLQADQVGDIIYKIAELKRLSVYCSGTDRVMFCNIQSTEEFIRHMQELQQQQQQQQQDETINYLLRPISGSLRVALQKSSKNLDLSKPRIKGSLQFDEFALQLDDVQYRSLLKVANHMSKVKQLEQFRKLRPHVGLNSKQDRAQWWGYMIATVNERVQENYTTWESVVLRQKQRQSYIALYKRSKEVPYLPKLDDHAKKELDTLEWNLDYEDIVLYRDMADREITVETKNYTEYKKKQEETIKKKKASQGWFSSWFGGSSASTDEAVLDEEAIIELTDEARRELYESLGATDDESEQSVVKSTPEDWTHVVFGFTLNRGAFHLRDASTGQAITSAILDRIGFDLELKQDSSVKADVSLHSFDLVDKFNANTKFPRIISRRGADTSGVFMDPLLSVGVATNSFVPTGHDFSVRLWLEQLDFVVSAPYIQRVLGFFIIPQDIDASHLRNSTYSGVSSMQQRASTQLQIALDSKKTIEAQISIKAPSVIIPETCEAVSDTPMILVNLGHLTLKTVGDSVSSRKLRLQGDVEKQPHESDFYDRYDLALEHVKASIADYEYWSQQVGEPIESPDSKCVGTAQDLLSDISLIVHAHQRITEADNDRAKLKIDASVPDISVTLSPQLIGRVVCVLNGLITSGLIDNPTGSTKGQHNKLLTETLRVGGPLDNGTDFQCYWVELDKYGSVHLKRRSSQKRPIASISLQGARIVSEINDLADGTICQEAFETVERDLMLQIVLPQSGDTPDQVFSLLFPSQTIRAQWLGALKEAVISFETDAPIGDAASSSPLTEEEETSASDTDDTDEDNVASVSPQETAIAASFQLNRFTITLNNNSRDIGEIALSSLSVKFSQRTFDTTANVQLESFSIKDLWTQERRDNFILCSESDARGDILNLSFVQVQSKESPLFKDDHSDAQKRLKLKLGKSHMFFDPNIMTQFVLFVHEVQRIVSGVKTRVQSFQASFEEHEQLPGTSTESVQPQENQHSALQLDTELAELSLTLVKNGRHFVHIAVQGTCVSMLNSLNEMQVEGLVESVAINDLSEGTRHQNILIPTSNSDKAFAQFSFRQIKSSGSDETEDDNRPYFDKFVVATVASVRFVVLQRFIKQLQDFFTRGILWDTLRKQSNKEQTNDPTQPLQQQNETKSAAAAAGRMSLNVKVLDPRIVLPISWQSKESIIVSLDSLQVQNGLDSVTCAELSEVNYCETYAVSIVALTLKSSTNGKIRHLTNGIDCTLSAALALRGTSIPSLDFKLSTSAINIELARSQYELLLSMVDKNFGDNGGIVSQPEPSSLAIQEEVSKEEVSTSSPTTNSISLFNVSLPKLSVTLLRGDGELVGKVNKLASLNLDTLNVVYESDKNDKSSSCKVELVSIDAKDLRAESDSCFTNFISSQQIGTFDVSDAPFLRLSMENNGSTGSMALDANISRDPHVILVPDVMMEIANFFTAREASESKDSVESLPQARGDFHVSQAVVHLGEDFFLSGQRRMIIEPNEEGELVIDGQGHTVHFSGSPSTLITVPSGMTVRFRNIRLRYRSDSEALPDNIIVDEADGAIREQFTTDASEQQQQQPQQQEASPKKKNDITFNGCFKSISLIVPENCSDANTCSLLVTVALAVSYSRTDANEKGNVNIQSLQMQTKSRTSTSAPMIDAAGISASISSESAQVRNVLLDIAKDDLKLRFSYLDTKLLSNIVTNLKSATQKPANGNADLIAETRSLLESRLRERGTDFHYEVDPEYEILPAHKSVEVAFVVNDDSSTFTEGGVDTDHSEAFFDPEDAPPTPASDDESHELSSTVVTSSAEEASSTASSEFHFAIKASRKISLLLVDDVRGWDVPLVDVSVYGLSLDNAFFNSGNGEFCATVKLTLSSSFYNVRLAYFEPILEPFPMEFTIVQTSTPQPTNPDAKLLVASLRTALDGGEAAASLNVNVSRNMISSITNTLQLWKADYTKSSRTVSRRFDPFIVRNHCGRHVRVSWKGGSGEWSLQPNQDQGLQRTFDSASQTCDLVVQVDGFAAVTVNAVRVGSSSILSTDKRSLCCVAVSEFEGRKFITVRSGFSVRNDTNVPIEIGLVQKSSGSVDSIAVIGPRTDRGVPIMDDLNGTSLCVRPCDSDGSSKFQWSAIGSTTFCSMLQQGGSQVFESTPLHGGDTNPFYVVANVTTVRHVPSEIKQKYVQANAWHRLESLDHQVRLIPPLSVSNLLHSKLHFSVFTKAAGKKSDHTECASSTLESGESHHIHTANPSTVLLLHTVLAGGTHEGRWIATDYAQISEGGDPKRQLSPIVSMKDDRKNVLHLRLDYEIDRDASRHVLIYAPHWIVNHTGKPISVMDAKDKPIPGGHLFAESPLSTTEHEPLLISPVSSNAAKVKIMSGSYKAKQSIDLTAATVPQAVALQDIATKSTLQFTVSSSAAPGLFSRTLITKISPRYMVVNELDAAINIRHVDDDASLLTVKAGDRQPLFSVEKEATELELQWADSDSEQTSWSNRIRLEIGTIPLRLGSSGLNIDVQEDSGVTFVVLKPLTHPPYILRNKTPYKIQFASAAAQAERLTVLPHSSLDYWQDGAARASTKPELTLTTVGSSTVSVKIPLNTITSTPTRCASVDSVSVVMYSMEARGPTRVINVFTDESTESESTDQEFEEMVVSVLLPKISLSLVDSAVDDDRLPEEILFISLDFLELHFKQTNKDRKVSFILQELQVDNQMHDAYFPVLLARTIGGAPAAPVQPIINFSLVQDTPNNSDDTLLFHMMHLAVQEFDVRMSSDVLIRLQQVFGAETGTDTRSDEIADVKVAMAPVQQSIRDQRIYFRELKLHPLHFHLSFKTTEVLGEEFRKNSLFLALNQAVGSVINIDDADLRFNLMHLDTYFSTMQDLKSRVTQHYVRGFMLQIFKVLLSLEAIGNPVGLAMGVGSGVHDLFYEPINAVVTNPMDITGAVAKGTTSFVSKSLQGGAHSASKVSGSIGKALGALSFDSEYVKEREKASRKRASNLKEGLSSGMSGLGRSVGEGVSGLFVKPVKEAKKGGIGGFMKGIGKGIAGVPVKPIAGVVDLVTKTSEGLSNQGKAQHHRRRLPRTFRQDGALVSYDEDHSKVNALLSDHFPDERALHYCSAGVSEGGPSLDEAAVLGRTGVFFVSLATNKILWTAKYDKIMSVQLHPSESEPKSLTIIVAQEQDTHKIGTLARSIAGRGRSRSSSDPPQTTRSFSSERDPAALIDFFKKLQGHIAIEEKANLG